MASLIANPLANGGGVSLLLEFDVAVTRVRLQRYDPGAVPVVPTAAAELRIAGGLGTYVDTEAPLDTPVYYDATQVQPAGTEFAVSNTVTVASDGYTWLKYPGKPTLSIRLDWVTSIEVLARAARRGIFAVAGRANPVVISDYRSGPEGELVFTTNTAAQAQGVRNIIATGGVLLLQTPAVADLGNLYVSAGDVSEARVSPLVYEAARRWSMPFTVTDRPAGMEFMAVGNTWQDVHNFYGDWQTFFTAQRTWAQVLSVPITGVGQR